MASNAQKKDEVPVGAVIVLDDQRIAATCNSSISLCDPTAHAEILAIREAGKQLRNYRLIETTLYCTLEPCMMCVGAMIHARIKRLVFGAYDPKSGAAGSAFKLTEASQHNHCLEVLGGMLQEECGKLLQDFFKLRR